MRQASDMASPKRPKLSDQSARSRSGIREAARIAGTCQIGDRQPEQTLITDISADGCRMRTNSVGVTKSEAIVLRLGDEAPITGRLKWLKQASLGIAFDEPLRADLLQRLGELKLPDNVVPIRRAKVGSAQ
jgi:hypothetical protein